MLNLSGLIKEGRVRNAVACPVNLPGSTFFQELGPSRVAQLFIFYARHLDMDVDPVEQRAGSVILIFGDHSHRTGARFDGIAMVAAGQGFMAATK